jgi:hypothetical protein
MFKDNADLYPTPAHLANRMLKKVKNWSIENILEPSAGLGHLIQSLKEFQKYRTYNISAIEIDNNCRNILRGKNINIIDSDFLAYNGLEQFDLIIANFPFSDGDKHLHKAIDILFSGEIVCLINAETLKNPYSNSRKDLVQKLKVLNADIEYIQDAFLDAERKTGVEVALIHIEKIQDVETQLFNNMNEDEDINMDDIQDSFEVATKNDIGNIVKRYNQDKETVTSQIMDFYRNYKFVSQYLDLKIAGLSYDDEKSDKYKYNGKNLTEIMKIKLNQFSKNLKRKYWLEAMELKEIKSRLTSKKKIELANELNQYCNMDFTETNIKIFIENLIVNYPKMIDEAIEYIFDKMTEHAFWDARNNNNEWKANIHLYNGWKTNNAYKINKKVILPFYKDGCFGTDKENWFNDIDLVFNYFDDKGLQNDLYLIPEKYKNPYKKETETLSSAEIVRYELAKDVTKNIKTRYFTITVYKKGTIHFVFNDLDILRKFNIFIAKRRNWLPSDYGFTEKRNKDVDFETDKDYKQIGTELAINTKNILMLN